MPSIRIKEAYQTTKHVIEGIELNWKVEELKKIAAEKTNIPVEEQSKLAYGLNSPLSFHIYFVMSPRHFRP